MSSRQVRLRRREGAEEESQQPGMPSECLSTPQSLNRSIPCVYESSQFTAQSSASFIDSLTVAVEPTLSNRARTAVVGPNTVHRSGEGSSYDYGPIDKTGSCISY
ncbi:unnamed protein product [Gongylonema pulchrum]|uniref:Uncharacterized protein n=1 Tax=Gongylonema pulchrum TaxID=637853 RepID=A0A183E7Y8_9BILA|nr:unnamed protein product [Gongylonema pulchrum]